jgi:hypothetical protein
MDWGWPLATGTMALLQTRSAPVDGKELLPASRFEYLEGKATLVVLGTLTLATEVEPKVLAARLDKVHNLGKIHCTPEQMGALQARLGLRQGELVDATTKPEPPAEEEGVIRIDNAGHLKL